MKGSEVAQRKLNTWQETKRIDDYLARIAKNDRKALSELYQMISAPIYSFALSILKNTHDAEDVLQDVFIAIASSASDYQTYNKPMAWVMTITRNLSLMKIRDSKKDSNLAQDDWEPYLASNKNMTSQDRLIIQECLQNLSNEERQIVVLHAVAGLKHREIAKSLSLPLPTVLSKYSRAMKKLKNHLMEEE